MEERTDIKLGENDVSILLILGYGADQLLLDRLGDIKTSIRLRWSYYLKYDPAAFSSNISEILKTGICLKYYLVREKHLLFHHPESI